MIGILVSKSGLKPLYKPLSMVSCIILRILILLFSQFKNYQKFQQENDINENKK